MSVSPLRRLLAYSRAYRKMALKASICSVANKFFDVMPEILIGVGIDVVTRREQSFLAVIGISRPETQIIFLTLLTLVIWVSESVFEYLYGVLWQNLAQLVQHDLRIDAFKHTQKLDLEWFDGVHSGEIASTLNDDINQLERFLNVGANSLLQVAAAVVFIGAVFFWLAWDIALVAIVPIPLILWGAGKYRKMAEPRYKQVREASGQISAQLASSLAGVSTIKAFAAEAFEAHRLSQISQDYVAANSSAIKINSAFTPVIRMAVLSGFAGTLLLAGLRTIHGEIPVGSFGILVFLTQRLLWPFTSLGQTVDLYQRAMASCERILNLLEVTITTDSGTLPLKKSEVKGQIKFENVTFGYKGRGDVIKDLSFEIPAGKTVAIIGATGSGKSTVAKLIMKFVRPSAGRVTIDGHDLSDIAVADLRRAIGLVSQDVYLFSDSIESNIAYGLTGAGPDDVRAAAKAAAANFISDLPAGFATIAGERGQQLSGGQRQRIGLARALLRQPPILILDEATSAVDNETERLIQESLETVKKNRTVIVIAHRLSTVKNADLILVLDRGRLVEKGTHHELASGQGFYARQLGAKD